jgi:hypothetical protein
MNSRTPRNLTFGIMVLGFVFLGSEIRSQTPSNQLRAEETVAEIRKNPNQAQEIVRRLIRESKSAAGDSTGELQKQVAVVVGAAVAALPRDQGVQVLQSAFAEEPGLAPVIAQTALAVYPTGLRSQTSGSIPIPGMVSGAARVLRVEGGEAVSVDPDGKQEKLQAGAFLQQGSSISTGPKSTVDLLFENGTTIRIEPGTELSIDRLMTSPFDPAVIDYETIQQEPGSSNTLIGVSEGTIFFDVAKLKKESAFQISTPLGIAGIRGTAGFSRSDAREAAAPVSFGLATGSAQFSTPNGNARPIARGEAYGVAEPNLGYEMKPNPPNARNLIAKSGQFGRQARSSAGSSPFVNAPPRTAVDFDSNLTAEQILALTQAAQESQQALVQTALLLAMANPVLAPEIAAFASALLPPAAIEVALAITGLYPNLAPAVAVEVAAVVPAMAVTIAIEVIRENQTFAAAVATSIVAVVPGSAVSIVGAVAREFPELASTVANAMISAVPAQGDVVKEAEQQALGNVDSNNQAQTPITPPAPENATENPGVLNPIATPTPPPSPTPPAPTPTPTPVSPSA